MEMNFRKYFEMSYQPQDIPEFFYAAIKFNLPALKAGRLENFRGISQNASIMEHFLGPQTPIGLKMPGKDVAQLNKITKFMYDNPNYLVSNDTEALSRILMSGRAQGGVSALLSDILSAREAYKIPEIVRQVGGFKNLNQFLRQLNAVLTAFEITPPPNLQDTVTDWLQRKMYSFRHEGEWNVKPQWDSASRQKIPNLIIPKNTEILFMYKDLDNDERKQLSESGLENQYRLYLAKRESEVTAARNFAAGQYQPATRADIQFEVPTLKPLLPQQPQPQQQQQEPHVTPPNMFGSPPEMNTPKNPSFFGKLRKKLG